MLLLSLVWVSFAGTVNISCNAVSTQILPNPIITATDNSWSFVAQYTFRSDSGAYLRELAFANVTNTGANLSTNTLIASYDLYAISNQTNPNFSNNIDYSTLVAYINWIEVGRGQVIGGITYIRNINNGIWYMIPANWSLNVDVKIVRWTNSYWVVRLRLIDPNINTNILEGGAQTLISPQEIISVVSWDCTANTASPVYLVDSQITISPNQTNSIIASILNAWSTLYSTKLTADNAWDITIKKLLFNINTTCENIMSNNFTLKINGIKYINGTDINCIYNAGKLNCEFPQYDDWILIKSWSTTMVDVIVDSSSITIWWSLSINMSKWSSVRYNDFYGNISYLSPNSSIVRKYKKYFWNSLWNNDAILNIDSFSQTYYNNWWSTCIPIPAVSNTWTISWRYFFDYNLSKTYNTGDSWVDWVNVYLYQYIPNQPTPINPVQLVQTKKTDYYGTYIFTWLNSNGNYQVRFGIMSGFDFTIISDQYRDSFLWNNSYTINNVLNYWKKWFGIYTPGISNMIANAGIVKSNTNIYGRYHFDYNVNSRYDTWDSWVEWGNIFIYNCDNDSLVKQVRTDYYGNYAITWLAIWNYKVSAGILNTFSKVYSSGMINTCYLFDTNKNYHNYDIGIKRINNTQNWWTYTPSTTLYTERKADIWTLLVDINKTTTGTQIINTQYGKVQKTTTSTWTIIKLMDLDIYIDRSKPTQNEFPDIKSVQEKYTKAMPHVWVDMTDAYILAANSSEIIANV